MSDGPKAITRVYFKVKLQVVINQYGYEESQNAKFEMQHFPTVRECLEKKQARSLASELKDEK